MKIVMEPTEGVDGEAFPQHKVTIETRSDGSDIQEVGDLLRSLLLAWGYQPENVDEVIVSR